MKTARKRCPNAAIQALKSTLLVERGIVGNRRVCPSRLGLLGAALTPLPTLPARRAFEALLLHRNGPLDLREAADVPHGGGRVDAVERVVRHVQLRRRHPEKPNLGEPG